MNVGSSSLINKFTLRLRKALPVSHIALKKISSRTRGMLSSQAQNGHILNRDMPGVRHVAVIVPPVECVF